MARPELGRLYSKVSLHSTSQFLSPLAIRHGVRVPDFIPNQDGTYVSQKPKAGVEPCRLVRMEVEKGIVSGYLSMVNNERKGETCKMYRWIAGTMIN